MDIEADARLVAILELIAEMNRLKAKAEEAGEPMIAFILDQAVIEARQAMDRATRVENAPLSYRHNHR